MSQDLKVRDEWKVVRSTLVLPDGAARQPVFVGSEVDVVHEVCHHMLKMPRIVKHCPSLALFRKSTNKATIILEVLMALTPSCVEITKYDESSRKASMTIRHVRVLIVAVPVTV